MLRIFAIMAPRYRRRDIRILEDNERSISAQFHTRVDDCLGCLSQQRPTYLR